MLSLQQSGQIRISLDPKNIGALERSISSGVGGSYRAKSHLT